MAKKETAKAAGKRKTLPPIDLPLRDRKFVKELVKNGGNQTQAMLAAKPSLTYGGAATMAAKKMKNEQICRAIEIELEAAGASDQLVSRRVAHLLHSDDAWSVNEGIKHMRAIKGYDAEKRSHLTVDKRSINVNVDAETARNLFQDLLSSAKKKG